MDREVFGLVPLPSLSSVPLPLPRKSLKRRVFLAPRLGQSGQTGHTGHFVAKNVLVVVYVLIVLDVLGVGQASQAA